MCVCGVGEVECVINRYVASFCVFCQDVMCSCIFIHVHTVSVNTFVVVLIHTYVCIQYVRTYVHVYFVWIHTYVYVC